MLTHARALLTSRPEGQTAYVSADLRQPEQILGHDDLINTLDLSKPVAVILVAVLHFVHEDDVAHAAVRTLMQAMPPGSFLALTHATAELLPPATADTLTSGAVSGAGSFVSRNRVQLERLFEESGLALVEPGVTAISEWRPEPGTTPPPAEHVSIYGGLAYK